LVHFIDGEGLGWRGQQAAQSGKGRFGGLADHDLSIGLLHKCHLVTGLQLKHQANIFGQRDLRFAGQG